MSDIKSKTSIRLGDLEIPFKVIEDSNVALHGSKTELYESNKVYIDDAVNLTNSSNLKLDYDPSSDLVELGWIKVNDVKIDEEGNTLVDDKGNYITEEKYINAKVAIWDETEVKEKNALLDHVKNEEIHINQDIRDEISSLSMLFEMVNIGFSDEETVLYSKMSGLEPEILNFKSFFIKPNFDMTFNTFKIKMPKFEQNLENKISVTIQLLESSYDTKGFLLGNSINGQRIFSTETSEGFFEWNFNTKIKVTEGDMLLITFIDEVTKEQIFISAETFFMDSFPQTYIVIKNENGEEMKVFNIPACEFSYKTPNSIYFK